MKKNLNDIKEFIVLLDMLDESMKGVVLTGSDLETKKIVETLKKYVAKGILNDLEQIEEMLIVVDTVNGFMISGSLANPNAMRIVPNQIKLIEKILERNGLVVFVNEFHDENCVEFNTFPEHCVKNTWETELIESLKVYEKDAIIIEKNSTSFMFARGFINLIKLLKNLKRVYGNGVCSDICIPNGFIPLKNLFNQINRDVEIIIPLDSVDTFDAPNHSIDEYNHASNILMQQSGIKLVKTINDIDWRR